ncbi:MAG: hypothetical protein QOE36_1994 [Gaiellaceae bacterium]|nr:hypothetical protein [Gaiellaceae bacterium]
MLCVSGCGGGGGSQKPAATVQTVAGGGYRFAAPVGWKLTRSGRTAAAASGSDLVSVTTFPLAKRYRPAIWPAVVQQLDRVASQLALQLSGKLAANRTVTIGGQRARSYQIAYERNGSQLVERIAFVLRGKREYQLLCRYRNDPAPCDRLVASFRLA